MSAVRYNTITMKSYIFGLVFFVSLFVGTTDAKAYLTTNQDAFRINDQLALFVIEYNFGSEDESMYLPVRAARNQAWGTKNSKIGFEILKDGKVTNEGEANGVVTTPLMVIPMDASENEQHVTPVGKALPMSFYVILEVEPSATTSRYQVQVTDLPFYVGAEEEYRKLNPSELQYYKTPSINLNRNLGS